MVFVLAARAVKEQVYQCGGEGCSRRLLIVQTSDGQSVYKVRRVRLMGFHRSFDGRGGADSQACLSSSECRTCLTLQHLYIWRTPLCMATGRWVAARVLVSGFARLLFYYFVYR